jgi:hypothetical protein
LHSE